MNKAFYDLIEQINISTEMNGAGNPRGLEVKESLLTVFGIDPQYPCIDFEARKFNYKYLAAEVAWYLLKSDSPTFIGNFSNFWNNITNSDGTINSNYGKLLFTKNDTGTSQIAWAVNSLRKDKDSRQAIAYIGSDKFQYPGNKDFVCTQYLNFFIRNDELHMKVQMRSNDIFYGLSYDAPWFSIVHQNTFLELKEVYPDLKLGRYFHFSDNSHFYKRHFDKAEQVLQENITPGPKLELSQPLWHTYEDGSCVLSDNAKHYLLYFDSHLENIKDKGNLFFKDVLTKIIKLS